MRKPGRPKGSTTKKKPEETPEIQKIRTPEEIEQGGQLCAFLANTLWDIASTFTKRRSLTSDEALRLGKAIDPVLYKYMPGLDNWQLEINLLIVVGGIWVATAPEPKVKPADWDKPFVKPGNAGPGILAPSELTEVSP